VLSTYESDLRELFEQAPESGANPAAAANWVNGELMGALRRRGQSLADTSLTGGHLAELVAMIDASTLSNSAAKDVLDGVINGEGTPQEVATARDLVQISDSGALEEVVGAVIAEYADDFSRLRSGAQKLIGFFVGQVMKATGGKADPKIVSGLIRSRAGL